MRNSPRQIIRIEYSLDSLADITAADFEAACRDRAESTGYDVQFVVGLNNRETLDGEPVDLIVEHGEPRACRDCGGTGKIGETDDFTEDSTECGSCGGRGVVPGEP